MKSCHTFIAALCLLFTASATAFEWIAADPVDAGAAIAHSDELNYTNGFKAAVRFSCDLERIGGGNFANLVTKGRDFNGGYSLMVRKDGSLLVHLKGVRPGYRIVPVNFESGREYLLEVYVREKNVRVFVDGKENGSYGIKGDRDMRGNVSPLRIGGKGRYAFAGKISRVSVEDIARVKMPPPHYLPAPKQSRAEIRWTRPICIEKDRYIGWPSVCRLKNGDIIAVFSGDRNAHVCPYGKLQMVRSKDDGETWSPPRTIANGFLDDRDAGILQMPDGEIIVTYFTSIAYLSDPAAHIDRHPEYRRHHEKIPPEVVRKSLGYFRLSSKDNGRTWSTPVRMMDVSHAPHGPVLLPDGSLMMLGRSFRRGQQIHSGEGPLHQSIISTWRSTDRAHTWSCLCPAIADMNGENAKPKMMHEPHVVVLDDGSMVGMVRYHGPDGCMRQTESTDGGRTWTPLHSTGIIGFPPHLLKLPGNRLVCVYGRRNREVGFGEFACISDDGGRTWDTANEVALAHSHCGDLGYPASCLLPDGDILTVYYQQPEPGVLPHLFATKWRVTK